MNAVKIFSLNNEYIYIYILKKDNKKDLTYKRKQKILSCYIYHYRNSLDCST